MNVFIPIDQLIGRVINGLSGRIESSFDPFLPRTLKDVESCRETLYEEYEIAQTPWRYYKYYILNFWCLFFFIQHDVLKRTFPIFIRDWWMESQILWL